jgi:hypothetical protein
MPFRNKAEHKRILRLLPTLLKRPGNVVERDRPLLADACL